MDSNIQALELPAFEMDCRDWLVSAPEQAEELDESGEAPVVALLSTATISDTTLSSGRAVFRLALVDEFDAAVNEPSEAPELLDADLDAGSLRYVINAPSSSLALVADFQAEGADLELMGRFERLMSSFRWAS